MAEAIFKQLLQETDCTWTVSSAGTHAVEGGVAAWEARETMVGLGIDIVEHRSRQLSEEMLKKAGVVLTMTGAHKQLILSEFPDAADRVFTVKEFSGIGRNPDIGDPFGQGIKIYREVAQELQKHLTLVLEKLREGQYCNGNRGK